jgi:hypothetical protein
MGVEKAAETSCTLNILQTVISSINCGIIKVREKPGSHKRSCNVRLFEPLFVAGNIPRCICLLAVVSCHLCGINMFLLLCSERVFQPVQCLCRHSHSHDVTHPFDCDVTWSSSVISANYDNVMSFIHIRFLWRNNWLYPILIAGEFPKYWKKHTQQLRNGEDCYRSL